MKKVICFIFGHLAFTYNKGDHDNPEQAWGCSYCGRELEYGDEFWGFNINNNITRYLYELKNKNKKDICELPF